MTHFPPVTVSLASPTTEGAVDAYDDVADTADPNDAAAQAFRSYLVVRLAATGQETVYGLDT